MNNDSVIQALETALSASPNDQGLLEHLAQVLKNDGQEEKCLQTCQKLLSINPVNTAILEIAAECASLLGKPDLHNGYTTLLSSLGHQPKSETEVDTVTNSHPKESETDAGNNRVRGAQLRLVSESDTADNFIEPENQAIYLSDVRGMEAVKKRLQLSFLAPLKNPELMKAYGKSVRGGLLLYGPPGCGKTFIARALAGELGAKFINIGLSDILDMYVGESERKLHEIFETARRHAPAVLFIDEIDAIGQKRSQLKSTGMRTLVNQLLSEMDSLSSDNKDLFILAATNHPWDVDSALKRPGRFDRMVAVFPPDAPARHSMFNYYLKDKPLAEDINLKPLVEKTQLFSGADIAHLCNSAVEYALEQSIESGKVRPLQMNDLVRSLKEHRASTISWFETARNYAMFANEGGVFDELLEFIKQHRL